MRVHTHVTTLSPGWCLLLSQHRALGRRDLDFTSHPKDDIFMSNLNFSSNGMAALLPELLYPIWCHSATIIILMTSQWGTRWCAFCNQRGAMLVLPSSKNPHNINWIKLEILMEEIIISSVKQAIGKTQLSSAFKIKVVTYGAVVYDNKPISVGVLNCTRGCGSHAIE